MFPKNKCRIGITDCTSKCVYEWCGRCEIVAVQAEQKICTPCVTNEAQNDVNRRSEHTHTELFLQSFAIQILY